MYLSTEYVTSSLLYLIFWRIIYLIDILAVLNMG